MRRALVWLLPVVSACGAVAHSSHGEALDADAGGADTFVLAPGLPSCVTGIRETSCRPAADASPPTQDATGSPVDGGADADVDVGSPSPLCAGPAEAGAPAASCDGGWCAENAPHPGVGAVFALAPDDVWLGLLRVHGGVLTAPPVEDVGVADPTAPVLGVWGASPTDVWASTANDVFHFDGCRWTPDTRPTGGGFLFGSSASDVWLARAGVLEHFDGRAWSKETIPSFTVTSLHVSPAGHPWLTGQLMSRPRPVGVVLHRSGDTWAVNQFPNPPDYSTSSVWARSDDDVWVAAPSKLWHWDGSTFTSQTAPCSVSSVAGLPGGILLAGCSQYNTVERFDGNAWKELPFAATEVLGKARLSARSDGDIWLAGAGHVLHYDGAAWSSPFRVEGDFTDVALVPGTDGGIAYAAGGKLGGGPLAQRDVDGRWRPVALPDATAAVHAVSASSTSDVWATTTKAAAYHFDGASWSEHDLPKSEPAQVCTFGPSEAYALGLSGKIARWAGTAWQDDGDVGATFGATLRLSCVGPGEVWLGGASGGGATGVFHRAADRWRRVDSPHTNSGAVLVARRADDVWLETIEGFSRFDGNEWVRDAIPGAIPIPPHYGGWSYAMARSPAGTLWLLWQKSGFADPSLGWVLQRYDEPSNAFVDVADAGVDTVPCGLPLSLTAFSDEAVLMVRSSGCVDTFDGHAFTPLARPPADGKLHFVQEATFDGPTSGWLWDSPAHVMRRLVGGQLVDDPTFPLVDTGPDRRDAVSWVFASSSSDVWALGNGLAHFDGTRWTVTDSLIRGGWIWGASPGDLWIGGNTSTATAPLFHFNNGQLTAVDTPSSVGPVATGLTPNDVWIAGYPAMMHWNGYSLETYQSVDVALGFGWFGGAVQALDLKGRWWARSSGRWAQTGAPAVTLPPSLTATDGTGVSGRAVLTGQGQGLVLAGADLFALGPTGLVAQLSAVSDVDADAASNVACAVGSNGAIFRRAR
jgi:hypothetical protein